ncbi:hypothetical protein TH63_05020 [Rufibacter radiotolerans]|uniref:Uncharacterized protein n=1 Tax=Rufibacter radiotolerans TaxID=1379910 RepID=A0A0H4VHH7_9BACT|nr:hypothetical protein [Rufibacter radiotolerans]AKQ45140.1 hypothetical protein TH63_05020 [Rufibacter radiotolerans]
MKVVGNIKSITPQRSSKKQAIELHIDRVEYVTSKKDGRYYQDFNYIDDLDTPLVITGDCLALSTDKKLDEDEYEFHVYDKVGEEYVLNKDKYLFLSMAYDFDEDQHILSEVDYTITLPPDEFDQFKKERENEKALKVLGKKRK